MKKSIFPFLKSFGLIAGFVIANLLGSHNVIAQPSKIFAVSDLKRVFDDGYKLPPASDTIKIFGIRGEVLSGQCAFKALSNLSSVRVEVSELVNQVSGSILPAKSIGWNFVGSIPLTANASNQPAAVLVRKAPANFPDYLMAEKQVNVNKGIYQAVYLTITVPETLQAGNYSGKVTLKSNQGEQSIPLSITIYPLTLPVERHLTVTIWDNRSKFEQYHGIREKYSDAWFDMLEKYAENMASHRQNMFQVAMNTISFKKLADSSYSFDFTMFDRIAQVFWNTGKMNFLELGLSDNRGELTKFGENGWSGPDVVLMDISLTNSETGQLASIPGKVIIPQLLPALEDHLRQKNWLKKSLLHIKDEPSLHNALSWREASDYIHQFAPEIRRMDAVETSFLPQGYEVAIPKIDHFGAWLETYKEAARQGMEVWFYSVGVFQAGYFPNKTIDMPVIDNRIMHWINYQFDAPGYLHWGWNQWTGDPFKEPGRHIGDAWHVYPVKDGVLNSLRWEQTRNGIQDYEYLWMLQNKIQVLKDSLGTNFTWIDPKQRGKEIASNVVMGVSEHTYDPQVLYAAKMEIIRELISLNTSPKIYVQTNPKVNTPLRDGSMIEVFGWAEPGTKVMLNGNEIKVSPQGLFLENLSVSQKRNSIKVTATNSKGSKEISREFRIN